VTAVHIDTQARKSVAFEPRIHEQSAAFLAPDVTLWDAWPPAQAYIT
jgi:hypothetical protein